MGQILRLFFAVKVRPRKPHGLGEELPESGIYFPLCNHTAADSLQEQTNHLTLIVAWKPWTQAVRFARSCVYSRFMQPIKGRSIPY
jgi:hypothetical protein